MGGARFLWYTRYQTWSVASNLCHKISRNSLKNTLLQINAYEQLLRLEACTITQASGHTYAYTHTHICRAANKGQSQVIFWSIYPLVWSKYITVQIKLFCKQYCSDTLKKMSNHYEILIRSSSHIHVHMTH